MEEIPCRRRFYGKKNLTFANSPTDFKLIAEGLLQNESITVPMRKAELCPWLSTSSALAT